jgi:arylsulfatase A-like enzyme
MRTVVVLMDTLRRDFLRCYNPETSCLTPNISRFAEECCRFDSHYVGSMPCMPARRDIFCGRLNFLERSWGPIEISDTTLPKTLFERGGVRSHMITDHAHYFRIGGENYCQQFTTYEFFRGQESDPWVSLIDDPWEPEEYFGSVKRQYQANRTRITKESEYSSVQCFDAARQWVEDNRGAKDFMLMVETFDPHEPFNVPQEYLDQYGDDYAGPFYELPKYHARDEETDEAMAHLRRRYQALITMTDKHFGEFIDSLKAADMYDDTLIIFTTDHGYCLGEREYIGKNYMPLYNEIANIPLLVHFPGGEYAGEARAQITQNIDLMPTILEYQGVEIPESVVGKSLRAVVERQEQIHDYALFGTFGCAVNVFDGTHVYMRGGRRPDCCHEYTTSLTTIRNWLGKDDAAKIECGRYLNRVQFPVYRVPSGPQALMEDGTLANTDHLFDVRNDPGQTVEVRDESVHEEMEELLRRAMLENDAPDDQFERLELKK